MLRRAVVLATLAVMLSTTLGTAGDVKTKQLTLDALYAGGDTATSSVAGFAGFYDFWVSVDSVSGLDTLTNQDFTVQIETDADDGNKDNWQLAYKATATRTLPIQFHFLSSDSLIHDRARVRVISDLGGDAPSGDSAYTLGGGDSTLVLGISLIAARR